jgi:hypothetical protein
MADQAKKLILDVLQELGVDDIIVAAFETAKLAYITDLGDSRSKAETKISKIAPGNADVLKALLAAWDAEKKPERGPAIPVLPRNKQIPSQTFNLNSPTIKIDEVTYQIPAAIAITSGAKNPPDQHSLSAVDWITIAKNKFLTRGIDITRALSKEEKFLSDESPLVWKAGPVDFLEPTGLVKSGSSVVYCSAYSDLRTHKIEGLNAKASYKFCTASFDASLDQRNSEGALTKRLYMTGFWRFPLAKLNRRKCTELSPEFLGAIKKAISSKPSEQFDALDQVFEQYGHAAPQFVILGGEASFTTEEVATALVSESEIKQVIQAAVDIITPEVGGEAGVELSIGAGKKLSSQSIARNANWVMAGGNRLVVGHDPKWSEVLADPNSWDVIARDGLDDLVDLLPTTPENIQEKVKEIWLRGQRELWGPNPPPNRARPDFHNCKVYLENTLVQREISDVAVECIVAAYSGRKRNVILSDVEADNPTLCKDYPPVVSSSLRVNAAANKLLWEFVYTGSFDLETGLPLYRIKSADGMWFLSQDMVQHQPA